MSWSSRASAVNWSQVGKHRWQQTWSHDSCVVVYVPVQNICGWTGTNHVNSEAVALSLQNSVPGTECTFGSGPAIAWSILPTRRKGCSPAARRWLQEDDQHLQSFCLWVCVWDTGKEKSHMEKGPDCRVDDAASSTPTVQGHRGQCQPCGGRRYPCVTGTHPCCATKKIPFSSWWIPKHGTGFVWKWSCWQFGCTGTPGAPVHGCQRMESWEFWLWIVSGMQLSPFLLLVPATACFGLWNQDHRHESMTHPSSPPTSASSNWGRNPRSWQQRTPGSFSVALWVHEGCTCTPSSSETTHDGGYGKQSHKKCSGGDTDDGYPHVCPFWQPDHKLQCFLWFWLFWACHSWEGHQLCSVLKNTPCAGDKQWPESNCLFQTPSSVCSKSQQEGPAGAWKTKCTHVGSSAKESPWTLSHVLTCCCFEWWALWVHRARLRSQKTGRPLHNLTHDRSMPSQPRGQMGLRQATKTWWFLEYLDRSSYLSATQASTSWLPTHAQSEVQLTSKPLLEQHQHLAWISTRIGKVYSLDSVLEIHENRKLLQNTRIILRNCMSIQLGSFQEWQDGVLQTWEPLWLARHADLSIHQPLYFYTDVAFLRFLSKRSRRWAVLIPKTQHSLEPPSVE